MASGWRQLQSCLLLALISTGEAFLQPAAGSVLGQKSPQRARCDALSALAMKRAIVVGAGPAGLSTALALRYLAGYEDVKVYEKVSAEAFSKQRVGAMVMLPPNGQQALEAIGEDVMEAITKVSLTARGRVQFKEGVDLEPQLNSAPSGKEFINLRWSRVREVLASLLPEDSIQCGMQLSGLEQSGDQVTAFFNNGEVRVHADLIVGADGIRSAVRDLTGMKMKSVVDAPDRNRKITIRAVVPFVAVDEDTPLGHACSYYTVDGGRMGGMNPLGEKWLSWFDSRLVDDLGALEALEPTLPMDWSANDVDRSKLKELLLRDYAFFPTLARAIERTNAEDMIVLKTEGTSHLTSLQCFGGGRVALVGDAAHPLDPSLAQGCSQGFEDAVQLATCLSAFDRMEDAVSAYAESREGRVSRVQQMSKTSSFGQVKGSKAAKEKAEEQNADKEEEEERTERQRKPFELYKFEAVVPVAGRK